MTFLIFWTKFAPKKVFPVENRKSEHYHLILHIWISPGTKFQPKLTILINCQFSKLPKKAISGIKQGYCILCASMVDNYYIKLFCTGADRCNGILMSLLVLVTETQKLKKKNKVFRWKPSWKNTKSGIMFYQESFC